MTTDGSNVNKGSMTEDMVHNLLMGVQNTGPFNYTNAVEILGSADKATRAINLLKRDGIIIEIRTEEWRSYGIRDGDKRKVYYIMAEASWAQREWDQVSKTIKGIVAEWDRGKRDTLPLINAVISAIGIRNGAPPQPSAKNMAMYRKKTDIDTLLEFYRILCSESMDSDYKVRIQLMGFMLACVSQKPLIGPVQRKELSAEFRKICGDALKGMKDSAKNATNNCCSPMALAILSFRTMIALHDEDVMAWMKDTLLSLIKDIRIMDDAHRKNAIIGLVVFEYFIEAYRGLYPGGFMAANRSELAFELLKIVLDGGNGSRLRDVIFGIRTEILSETTAPDTVKSKPDAVADGFAMADDFPTKKEL